MRWLAFGLMALGFLLLSYRVWRLEQVCGVLRDVAETELRAMQILDKRQRVVEDYFLREADSVTWTVSAGDLKTFDYKPRKES